MRRIRRTVGVALASGAVALSVALASGAAEAPKNLPSKLVFSAYDFGSSGFAQASGVANAFKKAYGTRIRIIPSGTSIGRLLPLTQRKVDYAFLSSGTYFASEGLYDFADPTWGPQDLRCVLAPPASTGIVLRGDSKFSDARDIKGIRLGYVKGSPAVNVKTDGVLAFAGLDPIHGEEKGEFTRVWHGGYGVMKTSVLTGKIDGFLSAPTSGFSKEIEASPEGIKWLTFDPDDAAAWERMLKFAPMYSPWKETRGAGLSDEHPLNTLSFRYPMMVTYSDRNDDEVYAVIQAMDTLYPDYKDVSFAARYWKIEDSGVPPCEAPFHPAAVRYLKEKGIWTDKSEAWNQKRLARQKAVIEAWDEAQDAFTKMREEERAKGKKLSESEGWLEWWAEFRKKKGLD